MTPLTLSWLSGMASAKRLASSETSSSETRGMVCDGEPRRKCNHGFLFARRAPIWLRLAANVGGRVLN